MTVKSLSIQADMQFVTNENNKYHLHTYDIIKSIIEGYHLFYFKHRSQIHLTYDLLFPEFIQSLLQSNLVLLLLTYQSSQSHG